MIPPSIVQALSLDISVFDALLKRHCCSHGRAKYYQRCRMTLTCMQQRYNLLDFSILLAELQKSVNGMDQQRKRARRNNRNAEQAWEMQELGSNNNQKSLMTKEQLQLADQLSTIQTTVLHHFPEIISRIHHASMALFVEVSRGFFLPFCTVALGALARIRALILRMGRMALTELQQLASTMDEILPPLPVPVGDNPNPSEYCHSTSFLHGKAFEKAMEMFLESPENRASNKTRKQEQTLWSLGYAGAVPRTVQQGERSSSQKSQDMQESKSEESSSSQEEDGKSELSMPTFELSAAAAAAEAAGANMGNDDDDDDLGESMDMVGVDRTLEDNVASSANTRIYDKTSPSSQDPMDRNMLLVQTLKANKQDPKKTDKTTDKKKAPKKRKDASKPAEASESSSALPRPSKKPKKKKEASKPAEASEYESESPPPSKKPKKKKKKQDMFFDSLFD
jgi:hypothetical protein